LRIVAIGIVDALAIRTIALDKGDRPAGRASVIARVAKR
jgi:hypothetical protein